jgi:hypothetical protein
VGLGYDGTSSSNKSSCDEETNRHDKSNLTAVTTLQSAYIRMRKINGGGRPLVRARCRRMRNADTSLKAWLRLRAGADHSNYDRLMYLQWYLIMT